MKQNNRKNTILILGAGVAGLGAAITLRRNGVKNTLVLEKEKTAGGLCRSITLYGCDFDIGPKILLLDDSENSKEILSFLNGNYEKYPVVERTYLSRYGLLGFPLQRYLVDLPKKERRKILESIETSRQFPKEVKSFKDWLINGFGEYFCKLVLFPYEEKKWLMPLDKMDYKWALDRPIKVDYDEIIEGSKNRLPPNKYYYYPKKGNISVLTSAMAKNAGEIFLNCEVISINLKEKSVRTNKGKFYYEYLISSLPLDFVVQITEDLPKKLKTEAKNNFKRLGVLIFNLVFEGKHDLEGTAIYYPEKKFIFRRVAILQNLCPALRRENLTPISVELSINGNSRVNKNEIFEEVMKDFSQIEGLKSLGNSVAWNCLKVDFAYPLQTNGLVSKVAEFHKYYSQFNVYHCGRGGTFNYCNSDLAYKQGKEAALNLLQKFKTGVK